MYVKPAPGLTIRYPDTPDVRLPLEGAEVADSPYWVRRRLEGSVIEIPAPIKKGGK